MDFDSEINRGFLSNIYPKLTKDPNFKILSDVSGLYNCIGWAMGFNNRWVAPLTNKEDDFPWRWWPEGVEENDLTQTLINAFKAVGFEITDNPYPEEEYNKVVLYKSKDKDEWTHEARILTETKVYSKFGRFWDATHSHDVLCETSAGNEDLSYGIPYAYMRRPVTFRFDEKSTKNVSVDEKLKREIRAKLNK